MAFVELVMQDQCHTVSAKCAIHGGAFVEHNRSLVITVERKKGISIVENLVIA